jgi:dATP pyrophosphohydrolase
VEAVTAIRVSLIDVYVLRRTSGDLQCLALHRAPGRRRAKTWETVHGHVEPEEPPAQAALREVEEETGLTPVRLYNLSRVEAFYLHRTNEIALIPVFAAFVADDASVRLGSEHDQFEWLSFSAAAQRLTWPRERRALEDIAILLSGGDAGLVDDVLRVC